MLDFFIQTIISGVAWDLLKGTSKNILTSISYKIVEKKLGNETIQRLKNLISDFPEETTKTKKEFLKYLKSNEEFQKILIHACNSKSKHISIFIPKGDVYVQTTNFKRIFAIMTVSFFVFHFLYY